VNKDDYICLTYIFNKATYLLTYLVTYLTCMSCNANKTKMTISKPQTYTNANLRPSITVTDAENPAVAGKIHSNVEVFPRPKVPHIIFWQSLSSYKFSWKQSPSSESWHSTPGALRNTSVAYYRSLQYNVNSD